MSDDNGATAGSSKPREPGRAKPLLSAEERLKIDRLFFTALLGVAIASILELLTAQGHECEDGLVERLLSFVGLGCFNNLDGPLTLSLLCFALAVPGLAANIVTITVSIQSADTKLDPELRLPFAEFLTRFFEKLHNRSGPHPTKRKRDTFGWLRFVAIRIAQITALLGILSLFLHFHPLAALLCLISAAASYALTFSFVASLQTGQGGGDDGS
jgi:hypothetical protein